MILDNWRGWNQAGSKTSTSFYHSFETFFVIWFPDLPLITSYMVDQIWKKSASYTTDVN